MYNIEALSPEEKDRLLNELITKYEHEQQGPDASPKPIGEPIEDHPDKDADLAMLEPFAKVLDILIDKVESLEEGVSKLDSLVVDELFGGIDRMFKSNQRTQGIDGMRTKYGDMFSPFEDGLKELAPDEDIYEVLHDLIEDMKSGEGYSEESEMGAVKSAADSIAQKIAALKGEVPEEGAVEVEVTKTEIEDVEEPSKEEAFLEKVRNMKKRNSAKGL